MNWQEGQILSELLGELDPDDFFDTIWQRRPLFIPGPETRISSLFSQAAFERATRHEDQLKIAYRDPRGWPVEAEISAAEASAAFKNGATICISDIRGNDLLNRFRRRFSKELVHAAEPDFNAYYSPNGKGFALHLDDHPVWILQVEGRKHWRYSREPFPHPLTTVTFPPGVAAVDVPWAERVIPRPDESNFLESKLEPGDVLYLPEGTWHRATALGSSLHLTLGVSRTTPLDLIQPAVSKRTRDPRMLRQNLPGYWSQRLHDNKMPNDLQKPLDGVLADLKSALNTLTPRDLWDSWRELADSRFATAPREPQSVIGRHESGSLEVAGDCADDIAELLTTPPFRQNPTLKKGLPVMRKKEQNRHDFAVAHLAEGGCPVILTDAMNSWKARKTWTFDFFSSRYGDDVVTANSPMFLEQDVGSSPVQMKLTLADYVAYIKDSSRPPRGDYLIGDWNALSGNSDPLYDPAYRVLGRHPELSADVCSSPYFTDDLFALLPESAQSLLDDLVSPVHFLFMAAKGSVSYLHTDYWETHAYLAQIRGRKLCVLFAPDHSPFVYHGKIRNPLKVDVSRFPLFDKATPYLAVLKPGEMLFIPSGWWHFVVGLEPSITYSYDFFNTFNMTGYFSHLFEALGRLMTSHQIDLPPETRKSLLAMIGNLH